MLQFIALVIFNVQMVLSGWRQEKAAASDAINHGPISNADGTLLESA